MGGVTAHNGGQEHNAQPEEEEEDARPEKAADSAEDTGKEEDNLNGVQIRPSR